MQLIIFHYQFRTYLTVSSIKKAQDYVIFSVEPTIH